jgi:hypothetical protein
MQDPECAAGVADQTYLRLVLILIKVGISIRKQRKKNMDGDA